MPEALAVAAVRASSFDDLELELFSIRPDVSDGYECLQALPRYGTR